MPEQSRSTSTAARPWRTAILAGMASYLDAGAIITTGIALVLFSAALGVDPGTLGILSGLLTICFAAGAIIGGRLGDRYGRRRVFSVTLLVFVIGALVLTLAIGVPMLFVGITLVGFAIGADLPVSLALIAEEAPAGKKGQMIIFSSMLWLVGILVPIILSIFVAPLGDLGARILFAQLVVIGAIVLFARRGLRESSEWTTKTGAIQAVHGGDADAIAAAQAEKIRFSDVGQLFRMPILLTVLGTGLYYAIWNLGANSFGQFGTFFLVNLAGLDVQSASILNLVTFPLGIIAALVFMRVVDRPARGVFFAIGTVLNVLAFAAPMVFGFTPFAFIVLLALFGFGSGFCGEAMYKVWSQELFPTLLRSTAQGVTLAFARVVAGLVAFATPALASNSPQGLFGFLVACAVVSGVIGLFFIPHLKKASELEPVIVGPGQHVG